MGVTGSARSAVSAFRTAVHLTAVRLTDAVAPARLVATARLGVAAMIAALPTDAGVPATMAVTAARAVEHLTAVRPMAAVVPATMAVGFWTRSARLAGVRPTRFGVVHHQLAVEHVVLKGWGNTGPLPLAVEDTANTGS